MKKTIFKYPPAIARFEFKDLGNAVNGEFYVCDSLEYGQVVYKDDAEYLYDSDKSNAEVCRCRHRFE